jgi:enamine deaminase RidA (YjgF/YER057c/UK114 family)
MAESNTNRHAYEAIWPGLGAGVPKPLMPYSPAIRAGGWVFIAGTIASDFKTGLAPEVKEAIAANPFLAEELELQGRYVLRNLFNTMKASNVDPNKDMVRIWQWMVSDRPTPQDFERGDHWTGVEMENYLRARREFFGDRVVPSSSLGVRELLCRGTKVEVDMICIDDGGQNVEIGAPAGVPMPQGEHLPGVRRGDWIFLSAESPIDWTDGGELRPSHLGEPSRIAKQAWTDPNYWWGSSVEKQTDYVLEKLSKTAAAGGSSLENAVKAEVYIGHPRDFAAMDRAWKRWFPKNPPARVVIPYMGMGARGSRVEIALTLLANGAKTTRRTIETADAPKPLGHEPQAIHAGDFLFFSTQMAFDSAGALAPGSVRNPEFPWYNQPAQAQMRYMMKNVAAICAAAGTTVDNITRRVCFHSDFQWFAESISEWAAWFPNDKPASTTIRLGGPLVVPGADTLLDLIAYVPPR